MHACVESLASYDMGLFNYSISTNYTKVFYKGTFYVQFGLQFDTKDIYDLFYMFYKVSLLHIKSYDAATILHWGLLKV